MDRPRRPISSPDSEAKREGSDLNSKPPAAPDKPDLPNRLGAALVDVGPDHLALEGSSLERADFSNQSAEDIRIEQSRLAGVDLTNVRLTRARLTDAIVAGGSWANVRTEETQMRRVAFRGVRMTGADLSSAVLEDVSFADCRVDLGSFRFARLTRVRFERCRLDEIDFLGAELHSVAFADCVMVKSMWADATLTQCEMRGCDIAGAGNPERLRGVRMPWADVLASAAELAAAAGVEIIDESVGG